MQRYGIGKCVVIVLGLCGSLLASGDCLKGKKLLQMGWGTPMAETIPSRIEKMEKDNPFFDAVIVGVKLRGQCQADSGRKGWNSRFCWCTFGAGKIKWENVEKDVGYLRQAAEKANRLELFLRFNVIPGNVDWFDPKWQSIVHNASVTGRMIREGKCKGVFFDIEEYGKRKYGQGKPFRYVYQPQHRQHSFEDYAQQARLRGRQWIQAFQKQAKQAVIIFSWAHSYYALKQWTRQSGHPNWDKPIKPERIGYLLSAFIDGILEGAGDKIEIYDGCEYTYGFRSQADFALAREFVKQGWHYSMVPEIYKRKMKATFATEFDRHWRDRGGFYPNEPEKNYFTPERLALTVHNSLCASDGYAWLYSEYPRWWPHKNLSSIYLKALLEAKTSHPFGLDPERDNKFTIPIPKSGKSGVPSAKDIYGQDPEVLFKPLWKKYVKLIDLPLVAKFALDPKGIGEKQRWFAISFDDSKWKTLRVDEFWEKQGYPTYDGDGWYRIWFNVPAKLPSGEKVYLSFGRLDEVGVIWLNGKKVAEYPGPWNRRFEVDVTKFILPGKKNLLVVKVFGGFGAGGLWAPIKLIAKKEK